MSCKDKPETYGWKVVICKQTQCANGIFDLLEIILQLLQSFPHTTYIKFITD